MRAYVFQFCQRRESAVALGQSFNGRLYALHHTAIEFHLFAHMPIQGAGHQAFHTLHGGIEQSGWPGIYAADTGDFRFGGISRVK